MKQAIFKPLAAAAAFLAFISCQTAGMGTFMGIGAQVAAATGVISQGTADTITASGQAIDKANEDFTPEQEYYIGRAVGANILTVYKIWNGSPALTSYVNRICGAIVINSPKPEIYNGYHVNILDSAEINAFATSGGHIFLTRGLIDCADSEDALAGVIAHEIAHIQLQHSLLAIKKSRSNQAWQQAGISVGGSLANMDTSQIQSFFDECVSEALNAVLNSGYSRDQEFDADSTALSLMAGAGYDPSSLITMLRSLEKNQSGHAGGFTKTHPTPAQRITSAEKSVGKYTVTNTRSFREARYKAVK
jgi:predicted Zn-dependent protease